MAEYRLVLGVWIITVVLQNCCAGHVNIRGQCNKLWKLKKTSKYEFGGACAYNFVGDSTCTPELFCRPFEGSCSEASVHVEDKLGFGETFCGTSAHPLERIPSPTSRYLFVTISGTKAEEVSCEVHCSKGKGTRLKKSKELVVDPVDSDCECGRGSNGDRIVNGEDARSREFPWLVAMVRKGTREPMCGGALINNQWVLTAAHCFVNEGVRGDQVDILANAHLLSASVGYAAKDVEWGKQGSIRGAGHGMKVLTDQDEGTLRFEVVEVINHPFYTTSYDFDVTLLRLNTSIKYGTGNFPESPICLPGAEGIRRDYTTKSTVAGWGLGDESAGATNRLLQKLSVPMISTTECRSMQPHEITERMICAGFKTGGQDACTGDSGGPLISQITVGNQWTQIGVISWGEGCARENRPGVYSKVAEFLPWILHHTSGSTWCSKTPKKRGIVGL